MFLLLFQISFTSAYLFVSNYQIRFFLNFGNFFISKCLFHYNRNLFLFFFDLKRRSLFFWGKSIFKIRNFCYILFYFWFVIFFNNNLRTLSFRMSSLNLNLFLLYHLILWFWAFVFFLRRLKETPFFVDLRGQ
jgi:hypothetical protein